MRKCSKCKIEYELNKENFHASNRDFDGFAYLCKTCKKAIDKAYRAKSMDKIHTYQKTPRYVFSQITSQAKTRNIPLLIDFDYYLENLANKPCFYCGSKDTKHWIDRYINSHEIGYTKENSVPCCELCNKMKMAYSPLLFVEHCKKVAKHNSR